jgi:hypothetical protein
MQDAIRGLRAALKEAKVSVTLWHKQQCIEFILGGYLNTILCTVISSMTFSRK